MHWRGIYKAFASTPTTARKPSTGICVSTLTWQKEVNTDTYIALQRSKIRTHHVIATNQLGKSELPKGRQTKNIKRGREGAETHGQPLVLKRK